MNNKSTVDKVFETLNLEELEAKRRKDAVRERKAAVRAKRVMIFLKGSAVVGVAVLMTLAGVKVVRVISSSSRGAIVEAEEEIEVEFNEPEEVTGGSTEAIIDNLGDESGADAETGNGGASSGNSGIKKQQRTGNASRKTDSTNSNAATTTTSSTSKSSSPDSTTSTTSTKQTRTASGNTGVSSVVVNGEPPVIESEPSEPGAEQGEGEGEAEGSENEFRDKANSQED